MERLKTPLCYLRRKVANFKEENRIGHIYEMYTDSKRPDKVVVLIDKGKRDEAKYGVNRELSKKTLSVETVIKKGFKVNDFVAFGILGSMSRLGSTEEFEARGIDPYPIVKRFYDWADFFRDIDDQNPQ